MHDQYCWKPVYGHLFLKIVHLFAIAAFIAATLHGLWLGIAINTLADVHVPGVSDSLSRYADTEVHKCIESVALVATALALNG